MDTRSSWLVLWLAAVLVVVILAVPRCIRAMNLQDPELCSTANPGLVVTMAPDNDTQQELVVLQEQFYMKLTCLVPAAVGGVFFRYENATLSESTEDFEFHTGDSTFKAEDTCRLWTAWIYLKRVGSYQLSCSHGISPPHHSNVITLEYAEAETDIPTDPPPTVTDFICATTGAASTDRTFLTSASSSALIAVVCIVFVLLAIAAAVTSYLIYRMRNEPKKSRPALVGA